VERSIGRPGPDESIEYYTTYTSRVPDGDIVELLERQRGEFGDYLGGLTEADGARRYAPGKWSLKEVIGHLVDVERVFSTRALAFSRRDPADIPGIEQDDYVAEAGFDDRSLADLAGELDAQRRANVAMFRALRPEQWTRAGSASGSRMSVRAAAFCLYGHVDHHREVIESRYLGR